MVDMTVDREAKVISAKIVHLVRAEGLRLTESGIDRTTTDDILVNGAIIALVGVFRESTISDGDGGLVKVLRDCLRGYDDFSGKAQCATET
jgi:hypothetical protein